MFFLLKIFLYPLSLLFGFITRCRNFLYNTGLKKSYSFDIPIICVGNITLGGTGKTPHTELIIGMLKDKFKVACLSRGYKRTTHGFVQAFCHSLPEEVGDEPLQIKRNHPEVCMVCDEDRVEGVNNILKMSHRPDVIILDDAFQHRKLKAGKNIVLIDYNRPLYKDHILPMGRLRENRSAVYRADIIIYTKCPDVLSPIEKRLLNKHIDLRPYQTVYFTKMEYGGFYTLSGDDAEKTPDSSSNIIIVTAIAVSTPFVNHIKSISQNVESICYPDHYHFTENDIIKLENKLDEIKGDNKFIICTEKDAVKLRELNIKPQYKYSFLYIPIHPVFLENEMNFYNELSKYVEGGKK